MAVPIIEYDLSELASLPGSVRGLTGVQRAVVEVACRVLDNQHLTVQFSAFLRVIDTHRGLRRVPKLASRIPSPSLCTRLAVTLANLLAPSSDPEQRISARVRTKLVRLLDERCFTRLQPRMMGVNLIHYPGLTAAAMPPQESGVRRVVSIYDLLPLEFPSLVPAIEVARVETLLSKLDSHDWVICNSSYVRGQILAKTALDSAKVRVVPLAADAATFHMGSSPLEREAVRSRYGIGKGSYLLTLNATSERKNVQLVLNAFTDMIRRRLYPGTLVIAGMNRRQCEALRCSEDAKRLIIPIEGVREEDLAALYSDADAFLFPSLAEGFGLPPLEAMQCGCPVISSNRTSLPEVVGDGGILLDPNEANWIDAIFMLTQNQTTREQWRARGQRQAAKFSWERTAAAIGELYLEALASDAH